MQQGSLYEIRTVSTIHFIGALAQNAGMGEDVALPMSLSPHGRARIKSLVIVSTQNLAWETMLFRDTKYAPGGIGSEAALPPLGSLTDNFRFVGKWAFTVADGTQIAAQGPFFYYIDGLDFSYVDDETPAGPLVSKPGALHLVLVNRSATSKKAGSDGAIVIQFHLEPTGNF